MAEWSVSSPLVMMMSSPVSPASVKQLGMSSPGPGCMVDWADRMSLHV